MTIAMERAHETSTPARRTNGERPFVIVAAIGAVVFLALAIAVKAHGGVDSLDTSIATWFAYSRTGAMESLGKLIAALTSPAVLVAGTVIAAVVLWIRRHRLDATILVGSVFIAYAVGAVAKKLEGRARPLAPINLSPETEASFPSGHVLVVTTIALVALGLAWAYLDRTARIAWTIVAIVVVGVVSLDRLVVGAHWLTDVLGALALACVIASCAMIARARLTA